VNDRLRVLLVEDNPWDADLIAELLSVDGTDVFEVDCVDRLSKALAGVSSNRFDIVLLDLGLPDSYGLDALRAMRQHSAGLPIVVLTGNNNEQTVLTAIREGAQDYLIKGQIDKNQLIRSIKYAVERKQAEKALQELNNTLDERIIERTGQLTSANEKLRETLHELHLHQIELRMQNEELLRTQVELDASRTRYFDFYNLAPVGFLTTSDSGLILEANLPAATLLGVARNELIKQPFSRFILKADQDIYYFHRNQNFKTGEPKACELRTVKPDGTASWVHLATTALQQAGGVTEFRIVISDITDRKRKEKYREMSREVLQILNDPENLSDSIQRILEVLKQRTRFDAVGIRLQVGDDFPYFAQKGFPREFLLTENSLAERTADGGVCRDKDGNVRLECTCGLVLSGKTDPASPLFTPGGSFWINDSVPLLDIPSSEDPRLHPRNQCIHLGYASVALVPIRNKEKIVGLLQFNDQRTGCFTADSIEILETIAAYIGSAMVRKRAEAALKESEGKYRSLFENMTNGFALNQIVVDSTGKPVDFIYREVNSAVEKHTGLKAADILNKKVTEVLPGIEKDPADWIGVYGEVALSGKEIRFEQYLEILGRWFRVIAYRPIQNYFATVFEDITEKRRAEEIQRSLAAIVASAEDAIISNDLQGIIQTWNAGAENIFGYRAEEVIGKSIWLLVPRGHANGDTDVLQRMSHGEQIEHYESPHMRKDGTIIPVAVTISAIKDANGRVIGASRIAHDLTRHKQAERLKILNEDLELRVEQRTRELQETQKQYLHAEKLSAIGKLSASIAHEFNNPLQGIMTILKGLKKRAVLQERDKKMLDAAISESERIKNLILNLQDFNRPSSGRKGMVDVHKSLDSVLLLNKSDFNGRRIAVVLDYAEGLPQILAVPDQIKQVFLNLLINAADACHQPGCVITISTRQENGNVAVAFKDTGIGIQSSDLERIFLPFYTTKPEVKGTGLGLSVSYGIVKHHQGEIRVNSRPGEGATFTVLLPIKGADTIPAINR